MEASLKVVVAIDEEMRNAYLDYAMSVIIGRAIPDVRDGLKPVHRRILFAMHENRVSWNQAHKKSARIVGDVLGKYHPHGDTAVYDALVRMAQDFSMRYPLVDGQGNFGSVDGDPPAAMRYTEVRMSRLASELMADIEKETVNFGPNFDESEREPLVLPSRVPNLLINGSGGIAVGMATNVPPHNLTEIIDATVRLMHNPGLSVPELMLDDPETGRIGVRGPDFPTAGFIHGVSGIRQAYATGRGRVVMRARAIIEAMSAKAGDREHIVVTELPYQVNKAELLKKIADLARDKRIVGIGDIRDESDRDGMRVVIELRRGTIGQVILNQLYQMTPMQSTFGVNTLAIVAGQPQLLDLKQMLWHFIEHRREVVTRRTRFDLRQAEQQREIVEGLGMAVTEVDLVIKTIRAAQDADEARQALMALSLAGLEDFVRRAGRPQSEIDEAAKNPNYRLSERQAKAILDMRLARLTGLEREKLAKEYGELSDTIRELREILASEDRLKAVIISELDEIKQRYGDARRTEIVADEGEIDIEDLIAEEEVVVTVSHAGYVKRVPVSEYRAQGRGGRGSRAMQTRDEDYVTQIFVASTHNHVLFLSDKGKAYLKKVYEIPAASRIARGRAIVNFVGMEQGENLAAVVPVIEFSEKADLLTCTKGGRVKRSSLSAYAQIRTTGIIGVGLEEGDSLLAARVVTDDNDVMIGTARGMAIRFKVTDVRRMGRVSRGVKGIELREGDTVISMDVIDKTERQVLCVSERGFGKRTPVIEWRVQGRGGVGVIAMDASDRNGNVVKLCLVDPEADIMVITDGGQMIRTNVSEIREAGRNTQGVRVIRLAEGERVMDVAVLAERASLPDENGNSQAPEPEGTPS